MAPKDSAPEPELDEHVKRCRGQIIKVATEGGNKGISVVVGYQRRAFLHNGVIQLAQDFIAHRPGDEDISRTADALRCSEADLASLATGEILARGTAISNGDLIGPTTVRKRSSPDPREESFELPETPEELSDVLSEIQDSVRAEREQRDQRESELERLREENERLREENAELEQELADVDRLGSALEKLGQASNGGAAAQDVGEGVSELQSRVESLRTERDALHDQIESLEADLDAASSAREQAEERVADLEADIQELRSQHTAAAAAVEELAGTLDVDVSVTDPISNSERVSGTDEPGDGGVEDEILTSFQDEAVGRIMDRVSGLSDRERKLLLYIESRGVTIKSQKAWAQKTFGVQGDPGGGYYDAMRTVIDDGFVKKNKDGSIKPQTKTMVTQELSAYDVDSSTIDETYREVLSQLAE